MKSRLRLTTIAALGGIAVIGVCVFAVRHRIAEEWTLFRFDSGDGAQKSLLLPTLRKIGAEKTLIRLSDYEATKMPGLIFRYELPGFSGGASDPAVKALPFDSVAVECSDVMKDIRDRIGLTRARAALLNYMHEPTAKLRTRVWFAQLAIALVTPEANIPEVFRRIGQVETLAPGSNDYDLVYRSKPSAIAICIEGLSSEDRYTRGGAAFGLSLCGHEAIAAIPALTRALQDADIFVSKASKVAIEQISK